MWMRDCVPAAESAAKHSKATSCNIAELINFCMADIMTSCILSDKHNPLIVSEFCTFGTMNYILHMRGNQMYQRN